MSAVSIAVWVVADLWGAAVNMPLITVGWLWAVVSIARARPSVAYPLRAEDQHLERVLLAAFDSGHPPADLALARYALAEADARRQRRRLASAPAQQLIAVIFLAVFGGAAVLAWHRREPAFALFELLALVVCTDAFFVAPRRAERRSTALETWAHSHVPPTAEAPATARITVHRPNTGQNEFGSRCVVEIDGVCAGKIAQGTDIDFMVTPGRHAVRARYEYNGSAAIFIDAADDRRVDLLVTRSLTPPSLRQRFTLTAPTTTALAIGLV